MKHLIRTLLLSLVLVLPLYGQKPPAPGAGSRPAQDEVLFERQFVEAMREKVRGDYEQAIRSFEELLRKDKENHAVCFELAQLYRLTKQSAKALEKARRAHELSPGNVFYGIFCADLLGAEGRYGESALVFEGLAKLHPALDSLKMRLAKDYRRANKPDLALKTYAQIEARLGPTPEVTREKVALLQQLGKTNKIAAEWETLLTAYPGEIECYEALARFYEQNGPKEKVFEVYERLLAVAPDDPRANLRMAEYYKGRGEEDKYLKTLERLIPDPALALDEKIRALRPYADKAQPAVDAGRKKQLLDLGRALAETYPDAAAAQGLYGELALAAARWPLAAEAFRAARSADPNKLEYWRNALGCDAALGRWKQVGEAASELAELFPNDPLAPYFQGLSRVHLGRAAEALPLLQDALRRSGSQPALQADILGAQGLAFSRQKQAAQADGAFEKSLLTQPPSVWGLFARSLSYGETGSPLDRALEYAQKAAAVEPVPPVFTVHQARLHYRKQDFAAARTLLEKALPNGGDQMAEALELYGDVLAQLSQTDQAVDAWRKALEKNPGSATLPQKISTRKPGD
jgi:tetratricopeptide (TPR) repeat protein